MNEAVLLPLLFYVYMVLTPDLVAEGQKVQVHFDGSWPVAIATMPGVAGGTCQA